MRCNYAEEGNLIFIKEKDKKRPYICVKVFRNNAGVPYNWLVLPITSSGAVGKNNLFPIEHPKLKKVSFVKLNNIQTISWDNDFETRPKIKINILNQLVDRICKSLKIDKLKKLDKND